MVAGIFCWNKVSGSGLDSLSWPELRLRPGQRAGYKIVGPCPVMNVPVKQLYLSLITTFPLFIPVRRLKTRRYLKHCLGLNQLLPSAVCLSRVLTLTQKLRPAKNLTICLWHYAFINTVSPKIYFHPSILLCLTGHHISSLELSFNLRKKLSGNSKKTKNIP